MRRVCVVAVGVGVGVLVIAGGARGQAVAVDVETALGDAVAAYRGGGTAERVSVGVRSVQGGLAAELAAGEVAGALRGLVGLPAVRERGGRRGEIVVRIWPAARISAEETRPAAVALEMAELRAVLAGGEVTVVHARNPSAYFRAEYEGALTAAVVSRLLPPVPLPQLDLALGDGRPPASLTPYADRIVWESAVVDSLEQPTRVVMRGRSPVGAVVLVTSPESGRVLEFACDVAPVDEGGAQPVLTARVQPMPRAEEPPPVIDLEGRTRVAMLAELWPRQAEVGVGQLVGGLALTGVDGRVWTLGEAFAPAFGEGVPERVALVVVRGVGEGAEAGREGAIRAAGEELGALAERGRRERARGVRWWAVAVVGDGGDAAGAERVARWCGAGAEQGLWTRAPGVGLERLAPGVSAAVIVIGHDRRLVGVAPLDGSLEPERVREEVRRLVWPGE